MDFKQIKELIDLVNSSEIGELLIEDKDFKVRIRHQKYHKTITAAAGFAPQAAVVPAPAPAGAPEAPKPASGEGKAGDQDGDLEDTSHLHTVRSPMIGTFYRASSPDKPPYKKVGDHVSKDDVLCIIEAMKLFNEIESEVSGRIVKVLVENESPVEYDQPLFLIDPNG